MTSNAEQEMPVHRIRTDPLFYALLALIGSTYIVLVIGMLIADATYVLTSDMSERIVLDFSSDDQRRMLATGDDPSHRFDRYGLRFTTSAPDRLETRIIDSDKPSAANSNLGSPHQDFGGPGVGRGGRARNGLHTTDSRRSSDDGNSYLSPGSGENDMPLGNVIVLSPSDPAAPEVEEAAELVANWIAPVRVHRLRLEALERAGGQVVLYGAEGEILGQHAIGAPDSEQRLTVELNQEGVSRADVALVDGEAIAHLDYSAEDRFSARLAHPARTRVQAGSIRVVPRGAGQTRPAETPGAIVCHWEDPVQVDELQLLDIAVDGAEIRAFNLAGEPIALDVNGAEEPIWSRAVPNLGRNSLQKVHLNAPGVARLEIHLPQGGALAEMHFTWQRHLRSAWERDHPNLARLFFNPITDALGKPEIRYSIKLTLISCTMTAILSLWVAIPIGYLMSRHRFPGRDLIDAVLDIPIVLPPLVVGLSLLILFQYASVGIREAVVYQIPAVIIAQFSVACAFAVRTMRATFDQIDARHEQVALTLGCSRMQAFSLVVVPEAKRGILTAATLAWARSLGEFGPLLVFAGTTRNKTEVLSTTVFLELNVGNLGAAVAVSLIMVAAAVMVLVLARAWGTRNLAL